MASKFATLGGAPLALLMILMFPIAADARHGGGSVDTWVTDIGAGSAWVDPTWLDLGVSSNPGISSIVHFAARWRAERLSTSSACVAGCRKRRDATRGQTRAV